MPNQVLMGASMMCTFGTAPSSLVDLPTNKVLCEGSQAANIMDRVPMLNIILFDACSSLGNPMMDAATAAAFGVFTPMPCIPAVSALWVPGAPTVLITNMSALDNVSKCLCSFAGVISFRTPGTVKTMIP